MTRIDAGLRPLFPKHLPHVHWVAIESGSTGGGIPDLNGCHKGIEVWIECKRAEGAKLNRCSPIRPTQIGWAEERVLHGGRVLLAIRRHGPLIDELWLFAHTALRQFQDGAKFGPEAPMSMPKCIPERRFDGGPAKWNWPLIEKFL